MNQPVKILFQILLVVLLIHVTILFFSQSKDVGRIEQKTNLNRIQLTSSVKHEDGNKDQEDELVSAITEIHHLKYDKDQRGSSYSTYNNSITSESKSTISKLMTADSATIGKQMTADSATIGKQMTADSATFGKQMTADSATIIKITTGSKTVAKLTTTKAPHVNISTVVNIQNIKIREEMEGFQYPVHRVGRNISNVSDLMLSEGGAPIRNLIVTSWRSGSTFLGEMMNNHCGSFYHCEPMESLKIVQVRGGEVANKSLTLMKDLFNCNYTEHKDYITFVNSRTWLVESNSRIQKHCESDSELCVNTTNMNKICSLFPIQLMKTVRLRLYLVPQLLDDPSLNIRVIYLVRDPRGTLQSRTRRDFCPGNPDCEDPFHLCTDLVSDYYAAKWMRKKYQDRLRVVRYEDMSMDIYNETESLFNFFGLHYSNSTIKYLEAHTSTKVGGESATFRNTKTTPLNWRKLMTYNRVVNIQNACERALKLWGYNEVKKSEDLLTFNPVQALLWEDDTCS